MAHEENMKIINIKVNELKEYEKNPRVNDHAVPAVAKSIEAFGFKVPIVVDKDNVIIAGHTRLKAAKQLELEEVPCVIADDLTDEQAKAFRLADNKVAELSEWDFEKLQDELSRLDDMLEFGFENLEDNSEIERVDISEKIENEYKLVIECKDELEQEQIYLFLKENDIQCQILE